MTHLPYRRQAIDDDDLRRIGDLGDALGGWPELQVHGTRSDVRPGTPVPDNFADSRDRAQPRLDLAAPRAVAECVA